MFFEGKVVFFLCFVYRFCGLLMWGLSKELVVDDCLLNACGASGNCVALKWQFS